MSRRADRAGVVTVLTETPGAIKFALVDSGRAPDPVLAAGELRQGAATSAAGAIAGLMRPRPSKLLPRHFVIAATLEEVLFYRATGGATEGGGAYALRIAKDVVARFTRAEVQITDLDGGERAKGGTLRVGDEAIPVVRALLNGDPNTDELLALLGADA